MMQNLTEVLLGISFVGNLLIFRLCKLVAAIHEHVKSILSINCNIPMPSPKKEVFI